MIYRQDIPAVAVMPVPAFAGALGTAP
jgi:hypothetical protein